MKKYITIASLCLALTACDNSGVPKESSRQPKGNPNAAVVVTEFADLQCPACNAAHSQIVQPLLQKYSNDIALEFMHFPLRSIHRYALEAAEASECAADQGKFWEFIDINYTNQEDLNTEALSTWAQELGLNMDTFSTCLRSHAKKDTILEDYQMGRDLNVQGTPTFFVNGKKVDTGLDSISTAIDEELARLTQQL